MCKQSHADWVRSGYEYECEEILYLWRTWLKCRNFKQQSTGVAGVDAIIVALFGFPSPAFGVTKVAPMPKKVAAYTKPLNYSPIHLPPTKVL